MSQAALNLWIVLNLWIALNVLGQIAALHHNQQEWQCLLDKEPDKIALPHKQKTRSRN